MTEAQIKYLKNYPTADYLLKHKDAVGLCLQILKQYGVDIEHLEYADLEYISCVFEQKCYVGSKGWIGEK